MGKIKAPLSKIYKETNYIRKKLFTVTAACKDVPLKLTLSMPSKNLLKTKVGGGFYHIYNRGVEKRVIFQDIQDHKVFLNYLKEHLSPPPDPEDLLEIFTLQGTSFKGIPRQPKNYFQKIKLLAFCLMPNHFHLLIKQENPEDMEGFMRSLATRYSMYFNKKYDRVGPLFQSIYKASLISDDVYLLHLSRYIHLNPQEYTNNLAQAYSSYGDYLGIRKTAWIDTDFILSFFNQKVIPDLAKINSYKEFVEKYKGEKDLTGLLLESPEVDL